MNNLKYKEAGVLDAGRPALLRLLQSGHVTNADIQDLRRHVFDERPPTQLEIEDLFAIDAIACPGQDAWIDVFVDLVTDHLIWDIRPTGVLDEKQARWLMAKIDAAQTPARLALLVNIIDQAHRVPRWFGAAVRTRAAAGWPSMVGAEPKPPAIRAVRLVQ